jgi:hypothetical protein
MFKQISFTIFCSTYSFPPTDISSSTAKVKNEDLFPNVRFEVMVVIMKMSALYNVTLFDI